MTGTDFLLQAPAVAPPVLAALARQARARAIVPVGTGAPVAYRFPDVAASEGSSPRRAPRAATAHSFLRSAGSTRCASSRWTWTRR